MKKVSCKELEATNDRMQKIMRGDVTLITRRFNLECFVNPFLRNDE